jgi:hypothetical protein
LAAAARRWQENLPAGTNPRLTEVTLIDHGIHTALSMKLPLQFHVGFGDRDLDLHRTNPLYLLDFLRSPGVRDRPVMLLHCYPYEREAGYLAHTFENVYLDLGLAVNFTGSRRRDLVARSFEPAPFTKILYSSDALGPAELHYLGARLWRNAITRVVGGWIDDDDCSEADAAGPCNSSHTTTPAACTGSTEFGAEIPSEQSGDQVLNLAQSADCAVAAGVGTGACLSGLSRQAPVLVLTPWPGPERRRSGCGTKCDSRGPARPGLEFRGLAH